jgi:hypothetical protein
MKKRKQYHKKEIIWQEKIRKQGTTKRREIALEYFMLRYIYIYHNEYQPQHEILYSFLSATSFLCSFHFEMKSVLLHLN